MEFPQPLLSIILTVAAVIAAAVNYGGVAAQSSGCATSLLTLSPCVGYITTNVTTSPPPQSCCTALSSLVQNSAVCLCQLFTTNNPLGFPINQTRALALPGACKITTPPLTQCQVAIGPASSPSAGAGSSNGAPTESVPSSSPAPSTSTSSSTPAAVSPSAKSPSILNPPTTSVGGISPAGSEGPTSNVGALFAPSMIVTVFAAAIVAKTI